MAVVEAQGLWKIFGGNPELARARAEAGVSKAQVKSETGSVVAVRDATFEVREQEIFVLMGLSGSGKSTVLRCMNRLIDSTFGTVRVHGDDVTGFDGERLRHLRRTKMSMVFQNFGLFPHRSVLGNVEYGLEVSGVGAEARREKALRTLDVVGLQGYEDSRPHELSGGMQQRVGLARALVTDPEILLMDEPFSALDPLIRREMQEELLQLQAEWDPACTVVFVTHDLNEALMMGDRIGIMKDGRISQVGTPTEILTDPADEYVRSFVEQVDRMRVLPVRSVMRDLRDDESDRIGENQRSVSPEAPIADVLPLVLESEGLLPVRDSRGRLHGVVSRAALIQEVAGNANGTPDSQGPSSESDRTTAG